MTAPPISALAYSPDAATGAAPAVLAVRQLRLTDFRNYRQLRLDCGPEPIVLVGIPEKRILEAVNKLIGVDLGGVARGAAPVPQVDIVSGATVTE